MKILKLHFLNKKELLVIIIGIILSLVLATKNLEKGAPIPTIITAYKDRSFDFVTKKPPVTFYLKKAAKIKKGCQTPGRSKLGKVTMAQINEIAKEKLEDLNAYNVDQASKIILGSARSMGMEVV